MLGAFAHGPVALEIAAFSFDQFFVRSGLDVNQMVVGLGQGTDELVELHLRRGLLPTLGVLNDEHHHEGHRRGDHLEAEQP